MGVRFVILLMAGVGVPVSIGMAADEPKSATMAHLRFYVPISQLTVRLGESTKPLTKYVRALEAKAADFLSKEQKKPSAKGLLIAVGIKSKAKRRVWCQAVEGDFPVETLRRLEKELAKLEAIDVKKGPAGFGMAMSLYGQKPKRFPEFPDVWLAAAKNKERMVLIPPDDLFKTIWPD